MNRQLLILLVGARCLVAPPPSRRPVLLYAILLCAAASRKSRRPKSGVCATLFAVLLCPLGLRGHQLAAETSGLRTLTRIEQIRQLTQQEANRGYAVRYRAVVTYYTPHAPNMLAQETHPTLPGPDMFVQDSTAGIWVDAPPGGPEAKQGQLIEIEGISEAPDFAPRIGKPRWKVIGQGAMPAAHRPTFDRMASALEDSQWVEIEGIVRTAEEQNGFLILNVAMSGGRLRVLIPQFRQPIPPWLVDAEVVVRGARGSLFNQKNQLIGVLLHVPSLEDVHVENAAPNAPFAMADQPLFAVQRYSPVGVSGHRIHVRGVVTFQQPGSLLYISDGPTGLRVETRQPTSLHAGDRVDVVGFPHLSDLRPVLEDATFRLIGSGPAPRPIPVTAKQLLEGDYDSELVLIEADLLQKSLLAGSQTLILQTGGLTLNASLESAQPDEKLASLRAGSRLRVAGVCLAQKDENGTNRSFRILFDGSDQIGIIRQPSWWTVRHASQVLGWAALLILGVLAWAGVLRRRVQQQTEIIRQRLEREAALEEQYRDLFESANDLIQGFDSQGRILYVNRAWRATLGYLEGDLQALSVLDVIHPDCQQRGQNLFHRAMAGEPLAGIEVEFVTKSGEKVVLEGNVNCRFMDGKPVSTRAIFRNITARKRAQAENLRLAAAIEQAEEAVVVTDAEGRIQYVNPAFTKVTGYGRDEALGQNPRMLKSGKHDPNFYQELWRTILSGKAWRGEMINRRKDGTLYPEEMTITPVRDEGGAITSFIAVKKDIAERKRAEEARAFLASIVESTEDAIVANTPDGTVVSWNRGATALLGFRPEEVVGKRFSILIPPENLEGLRQVQVKLCAAEPA